MHTPVLLHEVLALLDPSSGEFVIDGTAGDGGHAEAIAARVGSSGRVLALDWDRRMAERCAARLGGRANVLFLCGNYADLPIILAKEKLPCADGLVLDLGFSSFHIEESRRGFSFMRNEPLEMTYDAARKPVSALLKELGEETLTRVLKEYGGERYASRIAHAVLEASEKERIPTTGRLAEVVARAVPRNYERGRIHPATRTFQALRIYANDELANLERVLHSLPQILAPGGRAVIISFHSLEDRAVKNAFRRVETMGMAKLLTKKPVRPSRREITENPRSRSAKLRAVKIV